MTVQNLSYVESGTPIIFPEFRGERVYMLPFYKKTGLPSHLKHWQKTIDMMLDDVDTDDVVYLMIDQGIVKANEYHRRPGVHVDGYWIPSLQAHGTTSSSHYTPSNSHRQPTRTHHTPIVDNGGHNVPSTHNTPIVDNGGHITPVRRKRMSSNEEYLDWPAEGLILASNVSASRAWNGIYQGEPNKGGDCSHINLSSLEEVILLPNISYRGNVTMLHESLPLSQDTKRTLVRLNVPGWNPKTLH